MINSKGLAVFLRGLFLVSVLAACGPSPNSTYPQELKLSRENPVNLRPKSADSGPVPKLEPLVPNGSFEAVDETGRPRGWGMSSVSLVKLGELPGYDPVNGARMMILHSTSEWGVLYAPLAPEAQVPGLRIAVSAYGRTPKRSLLHLTVRCKVAGEYVELANSEWMACPDAWKPVQVEVVVPDGLESGSLQVRIVLRNEPGNVVYLDHVHAQLLP